MRDVEVTVLMPMGGLGQRFADAGYTTPKPLIDVDGKPMFIRALESFPNDWAIHNVFVIRKDQNDEYGLRGLILEACPTAKIAVLDRNTGGAVETCLAAENLIDPSIPVIIADCDIRFRSKGYVEEIESRRFDGVLVGFDSRDARYSYAEVDDDGIVTRTAEKVVISSHALLGGYYFGSAELFLSLAHRFLDEGLDNGLKEFYVSHLFNMMLEQHKTVGYAEVDIFDIWGTPEELEAYLSERG